MTSLDLSRLSGPEAAVAMRTYGRRFRQSILPIADDPDAEELAQRIGPGGHSALDLVITTANTWVLLGQALHQVLIQDDPVLHAGVLDPHERVWDAPTTASVPEQLARLDDEATTFAEAIDAVHSPDWGRTGRIAGGPSVSAFDMVKEAVRTGADNLHQVETTLAALRA